MKTPLRNVQIGCGQITWPREVAEEQVLAEIAQAGYVGAPANPSPNRSAQETIALYVKQGLTPAPGYFSADFWNPSLEAEIIAKAKEFATVTHALGCSELFVAAGGFNSYLTKQGKTRSQIAGHVRPEDGLSEAEFAQFARVLNHVGEILLEQGVKACFHNHVGTPIETRAEFDQLLSLVDRSLVFLGPDTGHLAWAGADPVQFCRDYAASIKTIHVKDCNPHVREQGAAAEWDYATFSKNAIWTELGQGCVDFLAIFESLANASFTGWIIVETDVTQLASPLQSAEVSRAYLRGLGL